MIYFDIETRYFGSIDPEISKLARSITGTQDLSEDDKQRAANRLVNEGSMDIARATRGQMKKDLKKGPIGIKRALQGGKKAQYGNAAGRLATNASIIAGRDKDEIIKLSGRYNGAVRGSMELAKQLTRKDNLLKRAKNRVTGKKDRRFIDNVLSKQTYGKALDQFNKGNVKGKARAAKQLRGITNNKLDYAPILDKLNS